MKHRGSFITRDASLRPSVRPSIRLKSHGADFRPQKSAPIFVSENRHGQKKITTMLLLLQ